MRRLIREIWPVAPFLLLPLLLSMAQAQQWGPLLLGTASGGGGGGGGYVWSASHINSNISGGGTTSLTVSSGSHGVFYPAYGTTGVTSGQKYWEVVITAGTPADFTNGSLNEAFGIADTSATTADNSWLGANSLGVYFASSSQADVYFNGGNLFNDSGFTGVTNGDVIGIAYDATAHKFWFRDVTQNSGWSFGGDPVAGTNAIDTTGDFSNAGTPGVSLTAGDTAVGHFSSASWVGTAPTGYTQLP